MVAYCSRLPKVQKEVFGSVMGQKEREEKETLGINQEWKLSHVINELKQGSGKDQPKAAKKGETLGNDKPLAILMVQPWQRVARQRITQSFSTDLEILFSPLGEEDGTEGPMIIEAEIGGHFIHRIYVDGGSASEILYEHCFNRLRDAEHSTSTWMNFMVVRSPSSYNGIIGRQGVMKIQFVPSSAHEMLKFLISKEILTLRSSRIIPPECTLVFGSKAQTFNAIQTTKERIKPADTTGVPRHIAKHGLNVHEGCLPVKQKKKNQASEKNKAIQDEVEKLLENVRGFQRPEQGMSQRRLPATKNRLEGGIPLRIPLQNAGATYQRLVYKAFQKQIGINLEVYVDDLVIKSRMKHEIMKDIEETFKTLREINMKLNLKKCTFKIEEGMFLGYKVNTKGIKKSDFQWAAEAEVAFKQMKKLIAELPTLTAPMEIEELIIYLEAAREATSVDSHLVANQVNGSYIAKEPGMIQYLEKVKTLSGNFKKFSIKQVPISENKKADALSKIASTSFAHLTKQFLVEELKENSISEVEVLAVVKEEGDTWMTLIYNYLMEETLPVEKEKAKAIRRKSERYDVINRVLYKISYLGSWLQCVGPLQANYVLREIHEGSCGMHAETRSVVAKAICMGYYWPTMHADARKMIKECQDCQVHHPMPRNPQQKLTPIMSPWPFYKYGIDIC
nr:reverse transcriptase domain-containing protein [Tanacetum cinerariifolium]